MRTEEGAEKISSFAKKGPFATPSSCNSFLHVLRKRNFSLLLCIGTQSRSLIWNATLLHSFPSGNSNTASSCTELKEKTKTSKLKCSFFSLSLQRCLFSVSLLSTEELKPCSASSLLSCKFWASKLSVTQTTLLLKTLHLSVILKWASFNLKIGISIWNTSPYGWSWRVLKYIFARKKNKLLTQQRVALGLLWAIRRRATGPPFSTL